jgi:glycosyltransferase involved in cell wall biosynthesis
MDSKILLIANSIDPSLPGGRSMLSRVIRDVLASQSVYQLVSLEVPRIKLNDLWSKFNAFRGHIDGICESVICELRDIVERENICHVLIDGSNLGELARIARVAYPRLNIITYFHNVEARFFLGAFRSEPSFRSSAVFCCNYMAERKAVSYSDCLIALTKDDSEALGRWYGRAASVIAPIALRDQLPSDFDYEFVSEEAMLFVGGNFYANRLGIEWFIHYVMPFVDFKLFVVGKGMEVLRTTHRIPDRVEVIGEVDDLGYWYRRVRLVVAPIFDGSGMKTKVAEALMFGKHIIGTPEAFIGYEAAVPFAGAVCKNPQEFITAIKATFSAGLPSFDPILRDIYVKHYSIDVSIKTFERILLGQQACNEAR